jgi:hypothetical protein
MGPLAAEARELPPFDGRNVALQQSGQNHRSQVVQAIPECRLDGLEIGPAGFVPLGEDTGEAAWLFRAPAPDGLQRPFFLLGCPAPCVCWAGRSAQIFSLRAMSSWLSSWKR